MNRGCWRARCAIACLLSAVMTCEYRDEAAAADNLVIASAIRHDTERHGNHTLATMGPMHARHQAAGSPDSTVYLPTPLAVHGPVRAAPLVFSWPAGGGDDGVSTPTVLGDSIFAIPPDLVDNIAFWMLVFTRIGKDAGFVHDKRYPLIIYDTLQFAGIADNQHKALVRARIGEISMHLRDISRGDTQAPECQAIVRMFERHADIGALADAGDNIRFQRGVRERFQKGLERSGAYLDTIRAIFRRYAIPSALAYLPHVESSFDLHAQSKAGATGLWQFMPGTASDYQLRIDSLVDERKDPIHSTHAAARLLRDNFAMLHRWPLAVTAYNFGPYGMKRAVEQTGSRDISDIIKAYRHSSFGFASKNFYSCFLAAAAIARHPERYFRDLRPHAPPDICSIIPLYQTSPTVLCSFFGISSERFRELNPSLRDNVFAHDLQLPPDFAINLPVREIPVEKIVLWMLPPRLRPTVRPKPALSVWIDTASGPKPLFGDPFRDATTFVYGSSPPARADVRIFPLPNQDDLENSAVAADSIVVGAMH
jgi:hypothetical protein